jgi:GNAT superfamily N-acetyltransferase
VSPAFSLRPVAPEDRALLLEILAAARADERAAWPADEAAWRLFLAHQLAAQLHDYQARFPQARHQVVLAGAQAAGRLYVDRNERELRVLDFTLLPPFRNQGLGRAVLGALLAEAAAAGKPVRGYLERDSAALRLCARLGFTVVEERGPLVLLEAGAVRSG